MADELPDDDDLGPDNARVFLSYSRKDRERAQSIADVLRERHFGVYKDTDDILPTEEWKGRLEQLIAEADTIVFLMSPHSVASEVCAWEVEYATELNKRIAPIVIDDVEADTIPPLLARLNFIFATERDRFQDAVDSLVSALNSDIDWIREHTRLAGLARRWRDNGESARLLLRGQDIADAEQWRDAKPKEAPAVLTLHADFVAASRAAAARRQRLVAVFSLAGLAVALGLAAFALVQREAAIKNELLARQNEQAARESERVAEMARDQALVQRNQALISQSRMLTRLSVEQLGKERPLDAMLLALEALPDQASTDSARRDRPLVDDALVALKEASRRVKEIAVLQSGKGVHNLALSPDGSLLAAHSSDSGEVVLIDMASRAIVRRLLARELRGGSPPSFTLNGKAVVLPGSDGNVWLLESEPEGRIWKLPTEDSFAGFAASVDNDRQVAVVTERKNLYLIPTDGSGARRIADAFTAAVSPAGDRIAVVSGGKVSIHDAATGNRTHGPGPILKGSLKEVGALRFSPDGRWLAAWSEHIVWVLDGKTGKYLVKTGSRTQSVMDVNFSPDSNLMTVPGADGRSLLFDLDGRKMIAQLKGESGWATDTVIRPGNRFAVTVTASGRILLWDIAQDQKTATYPGHPTIALNALLTRDNEHVITSADDGTVRLWKLPADPEERESLVSQFAGDPIFSPDGRLVALSEEGVFDVHTGQRMDEGSADKEPLKFVRFLNDGRLLALQRHVNYPQHDVGAVCTLEAPDYAVVSCTDPESILNIWGADADSDGRTMVIHEITENGGFISTIDMATGDRLGRVPECPKDGEKGCYSNPRVSADGERILLTRWGVNVHVLNRTLDSSTIRIDPDYPVSEIFVSPSGDRAIIWSGSEGTAHSYDTHTGEKQFAFPLQKNSGSRVTFSPSGRYFSALTPARTLEVRDLSDEGEMALSPRPPGGEQMVHPVYNSDETLLLTGRGANLLAYDLSNGRNLASIELEFGSFWPSIFARGFDDDDQTIVGWTWQGPYRFPLQRDPDTAIAANRASAARCLTLEQRQQNFLTLEPPRWCITGAGNELQRDPEKWRPLWPYTRGSWRDWLTARDRGEEPPLPAN